MKSRKPTPKLVRVDASVAQRDLNHGWHVERPTAGVAFHVLDGYFVALDDAGAWVAQRGASSASRLICAVCGRADDTCTDTDPRCARCACTLVDMLLLLTRVTRKLERNRYDLAALIVRSWTDEQALSHDEFDALMRKTKQLEVLLALDVNPSDLWGHMLALAPTTDAR